MKEYKLLLNENFIALSKEINEASKEGFLIEFYQKSRLTQHYIIMSREIK
jgi:hypothetical protein